MCLKALKYLSDAFVAGITRLTAKDDRLGKH